MCFHLFSRERFQQFESFQIPEIFRVALDELCLQSKTLAPLDTSIVNFIGSVPEAPSILAVKRAVKVIIFRIHLFYRAYLYILSLLRNS